MKLSREFQSEVNCRKIYLSEEYMREPGLGESRSLWSIHLSPLGGAHPCAASRLSAENILDISESVVLFRWCVKPPGSTKLSVLVKTVES